MLTMENKNGSELNITTSQDILNPSEKLELHSSPSSDVDIEIGVTEQTALFADCNKNTKSASKNHVPSCLNSAQRKKRHSKDQHVHFTFDDFHYFSSQDESSQPNIYTSKYKKIEQSEIEENNSLFPNSVKNSFSPHSLTDEYKGAPRRSTTYCRGYSKRQWSILIIFVFAQAVSATLVSLLGLLYPAEAQRKGSTATEFGILFAVFELTTFLVTPICAEHIGKIGPKLVFNMGVFITGICAVIFGFLDRIDDRVVFIPLSISIIVVAALGDVAFSTSSNTIIVSEFSQSIGPALAFKETFWAVGLIVGPIIGGVLNQIGGFMFTFLMMGIIQLLIALLTLLVLPHTGKTRDVQPEPSYGIVIILKIPSVALTALNTFFASLSIGFLTPILEPYIRQFGLSSVLTAEVFIISGGIYAITSPIWSWICDKIISAQVVSMLGTLLIFIGFLLIGPAPFFPFEPALRTTAIGLAFHGLGLGATLVSSFRQALIQTLKYNMPDNIETYGLVSSLWTSFYSLGSIIGPIMACMLFDHVGLRRGTVVIMTFQIFVLFIGFGFFICCPKILPQRNQGKWSIKDRGTERELLIGTLETEVIRN